MSTAPTNGNRELWDSVCETDPKHTKEFSRSGGFKGTAINATYQVRKATERFGPVGIGWGYEEVEHIVAGGVWFSKVRLWYVWNGARGQVEHWGATTFQGKNKNGEFVDEEAAKKSITDALGKCLTMLGFAADVHLGLYDDNKYVNDLKHRMEEQEKCEQALNGRNGSANNNGHQGNGHAVAADSVVETAVKAIKDAASVDQLAKLRARIDQREDFSAEQRSFLMGLATSRETELAAAREPAATR